MKSFKLDKLDVCSQSGKQNDFDRKLKVVKRFSFDEANRITNIRSVPALYTVTEHRYTLVTLNPKIQTEPERTAELTDLGSQIFPGIFFQKASSKLHEQIIKSGTNISLCYSEKYAGPPSSKISSAFLSIQKYARQ